MSNIESFREKLQTLITKFDKDKNHYLSKGYPEAQVRIDFFNPFFKALGWDIENKAQKPPHERDVIVGLSPETTGRPDYNFRINSSLSLTGCLNSTKSGIEKSKGSALDIGQILSRGDFREDNAANLFML